MNRTDWGQAAWRKASYSGGQQACVEVAPAIGAVGVRDTKNRNGGTLAVNRGAWSAFLKSIK